jgi:probable HAF family extracellular repeat protein
MRQSRKNPCRTRKTRLQVDVLEDRRVPTYAIVDLGALTPNAINDAGQIAGAANGRAALWQNGVVTDLGTPGAAKNLNDAAQVVGNSGTSGFLWDQSSGVHLFGLGSGSAYGTTTAYGVNSSSQVVGTGTSSGATDYLPHAFVWTQAGGVQDINALVGPAYGYGSESRAINQAGQAVGWSMQFVFVDSGLTSGSGWQATSSAGYVWDSATSTTTYVGDLPGDKASRAVGINDLGQVIGTSGNVYLKPFHGYTYFPREAFLWENGVMTDLGMPSASAINNLGQVVGGSDLWQNGALTDLNTQIDPSSGWAITSATDINDAGQIIGQGTLNGVTHSFLLTAPDPSGTVRFSVSGFPTPTAAGAAGSFTVTALDANGNPATSYTGTVHFTSSDRQAALPSIYTFTPADAGVHSFSATLKTAGTQSIAALDALGNTGAEGGIIVQAGAASKLVVSGFPSPSTAGVGGTFTVTARDDFGNTASDYFGTLRFGSSDLQAMLPASYTFSPADNGVHVFNATLTTAGSQSISAIDTVMSNLGGSEADILVNPAAASRLRISGPNSVSAGSTFSITVTMLDAYGNIATGYTGTVNFKCTDGSATFPRSYTFTAADQGVHTVTGLKLKKKGIQTIKITDSLDGRITNSLNINVI